MDFAAERARIRAKEEYGVKTTRDWNRYYEEWDKVHPRQAKFRRIAGNILLWAFTALFWAVVVAAPIIATVKGLFHV